MSDPDARSMATSGRDTGIVGYNVQAPVDTEHHLIVTHEVVNVGTDKAQLSSMARLAALVPKPRVNLTRFHGVFAANSRYRVRVAGLGQKSAPAASDYPVSHGRAG